MNAAEKQMVQMLTDLRENHHLIGIKTEMEGEGMRPDDLFRLKEITMSASLPICMKIGGCEAMSDMSQARQLGVKKLMAPMVESPFALSKFVDSANSLYAPDELEDLDLYINVETISTAGCYDDFLSSKAFESIKGISIGRKDLANSMGLAFAEADSPEVLGVVRGILEKTKQKFPGVKCVVGGLLGASSLKALRSFGSLLDAYEMRKAIFSAEALAGNAEAGLKLAMEFEMLYYQNKSRYYQNIAGMDAGYIKILEGVLESLKEY